MSKKKQIRRKNNSLNNIYWDGGEFLKDLAGNPDSTGKQTTGLFKDMGASTSNLIGAAGTAIGGFGNKLISGELESKAGDIIGNVGSTVGGVLSAVNPALGGIVTAASGLLGGLTNRAFGSKLNQEFIEDIESQNRRMANTIVAGGDNASILSQWGSQEFGDSFSRGDIGSDGWFSSKAKRKFNSLKREQANARNRVLTSYDNAIEGTEQNQLLNGLYNYSALGGPLNTFSDGGTIHIKPSKRGTFTAAAKNHNMGVQEFASHVLANKDNYTTTMVKKANFAKNASKWHHAFGGSLSTNGADWSNGITIIGNGDTHENNPNEGVQLGVDPQGIPNLVEEGEVIFNDYVFSNRLKVPKTVRNKYKLKGNRELTFAEAAKQVQKESEERPNDPISKRGLEDAMIKLQLEQEVIRQNKGNKNSNKFATGGPAGILQQEEDNKGLIGYSKAVGNPFSNDVTNTKPTNTNYSIEDIIYPEEVVITRPGYKDFNTVEGDLRRLGKPSTSTTKSSMPNSTWLRYAPVVGNAIGLAQNLFSKPNYSRADRVLKASEARYAPVGFSPIGNYISYNPLDVNYMTNKLSAESAATRNAILNSSSPNRTAVLLAADYNAQDRLGDLYRKAAESNIAQRQQVENFNRATNMANAEMGIKAAMANQEAALKAANMRLSGTTQAMAMKDAIDKGKAAAKSASMTSLFDSLGNVGIDAANRADLLKLIEAGVFGVVPAGFSKGGKLKKKRGGFTY